jgi:hypothetical protein
MVRPCEKSVHGISRKKNVVQKNTRKQKNVRAYPVPSCDLFLLPFLSLSHFFVIFIRFIKAID